MRESYLAADQENRERKTVNQMRYTDSSRGKNMAKDPAVVRFRGKYLMYYSIPPQPGFHVGWGIGIAASE